jgi:peptidoglycan/xylan/chitin deacetylase (PgdA/CDA1 family)
MTNWKILQPLRRSLLAAWKAGRVFNVTLDSAWRRERLLILAYHGISLNDEHLWDGSLYMSLQQFRRRMNMVRERGCAVLPLGEAIQRLYARSLPPRAVVITFDDGLYDFKARAYGVLADYGYPVTLYQTTYYCYQRFPVFNVMLGYLLWKGRGAGLNSAEFTGRTAHADLSSFQNRRQVWDEIFSFTQHREMSAQEKDDLLRRLANALNVDYDELLEHRILQLLNPDEIRWIADHGVDVQLHTHRHCTPRLRDAFGSEIEENRKRLEQLTNQCAVHFCYPSGDYIPIFAEWLRSSGVVSGTTCDTALASSRSDPYFLPRLVDTSSLSDIEFEGWLCGAAQVLARR